jgi:hypothetical protein
LDDKDKQLAEAWERILSLDQQLSRAKEANSRLIKEQVDYRLQLKHQMSILYQMVSGG